MTREARVAAAVGEVVRAALAARGARRVALIDEGGPEAALAARWLEEHLGAQAVVRVCETGPELDSLLHAGGPQARAEGLRLRARLLEGALAAHPLNKTALLLGGLPPERLLPLGDLWASQVEALCGGWSAPPAVAALAERAGGMARLDAALAAWLEARDPAALEALPGPVRDEVAARFDAGRADRVHPLVVPKLSHRTVGVDLFE
jgi:hypothetical protein